MTEHRWPPRSEDGLHGATFEWDGPYTAVHCICGFYRCADSFGAAEREYTNHIEQQPPSVGCLRCGCSVSFTGGGYRCGCGWSADE